MCDFKSWVPAHSTISLLTGCSSQIRRATLLVRGIHLGPEGDVFQIFWKVAIGKEDMFHYHCGLFSGCHTKAGRGEGTAGQFSHVKTLELPGVLLITRELCQKNIFQADSFPCYKHTHRPSFCKSLVGHTSTVSMPLFSL